MVRSLRAIALPRKLPKPLREHDPIEFRIGVHDRSRVEWVASVGLPEDPSGTRRYEVEFNLEIPAQIYSVHNCWDHKQTFTRLQSPQEEGPQKIDRGDVDELRRDTLGAAHRLKTLRQKFERVCLGAVAQRVPVQILKLDQLASDLGDLAVQAAEVVEEIRRCLDRPPTEVSSPNLRPEVVREWALADEFLSHQLLDFLGAAEHAIEEVVSVGPGEWCEELRCLLAEALSEELVHRSSRGHLNPGATSQAELARFVERGSRLKKHFHDVLFLDVEAYMVDWRLRNWTGVAAASIAAAFWLAFTLIPIGPGTRAGIGVSTFAVLFAVTYALKDRIKELTRTWIAGRLVRLYGQRVVNLRLPARLDLARKVLVEARETFDVIAITAGDALNEEVGRTRRVTLMTFRMKAAAHGSAALARAGIRSIKHVYRYDLTPIFARLDDAVKSIPVLDAQARRVRFVEAPKEYRVPITVLARSGGAVESRVSGDLILSKRGIERLELAE